MTRFRKRLLAGALALAALIATALPVQAGSFLGGNVFNGNAPYSGSTTGDPTVSFAVVDTGTAGGSTAYLQGLAGATGGSVNALYNPAGSGRYVYIYEVVNSSQSTLGSFGLRTSGGLYTEGGEITTSVFTNAPNGGSPVIGVSNGGNNGFVYTAADNPNTYNYATGNSGAIPISPNNPTGIDVESNSVTFFFRSNLNSGNTDQLTPGTYTTLLFLVSDSLPTLGIGQLNDTVVGASGLAPMASAPEPQSYALMMTGLLGLGTMARWRRRSPKSV